MAPLPPARLPQSSPAAQQMRPWIGVRFLCAGQYLRVYRNRAGDAYLATCPKCARVVKFRVGESGVRERFFDVHC